MNSLSRKLQIWSTGPDLVDVDAVILRQAGVSCAKYFHLITLN